MREAACVVIVRDRKVLCVSRPNHPELFCLPGGKRDQSDVSIRETARRELYEETGINASHLILAMSGNCYTTEPGGETFHTTAFVCTWSHWSSVYSPEGLELRWMHADELLAVCPFADYCRTLFDVLEREFNVHFRGEQ